MNFSRFIFLIGLLFIASTALAQDFSQTTLIGKWKKVRETDENGKELEKLSITDGEESTDKNSIDQYLTFKADGFCVMSFEDSNKVYDSYGSLKYELTGHFLMIKDRRYKVIELTESNMILFPQGNLFTTHEHFEKVE